ncbi:glycosyltransferase [Candidatus Pelagibacter sp.]|nr:glycosyltransferase [Candidatus Pelagibacter sp.]|tara:strand:+ start:553 stop:1428 length:876 start_codon:yes stop_codon:yes gene_type:complete
MNNNLYNKITIVIVLYEEDLQLINQCLENIKNFNIIIIDNAGNKKLKNGIQKKYDISRYILNSKNVGYSKAVNQGIKLCATEYVFVFQADCLMNIENIDILFNAHKKYDNCFLVSPTYYDSNSKISFNGGTLLEKNLGNNTVIQLEGDLCVDNIVTAAYLFKKKDMIEIGLFDENFFIYFLDNDFGRTVSGKKKSIIQVFNSKAIHTHGSLKVKNFFKKIFFRNYHYTFDELYYYYKINEHDKIFMKLKKKIPNYIVKSFLNIFILRFDKTVRYFALILAFFKFKNFLKKN